MCHRFAYITLLLSLLGCAGTSESPSIPGAPDGEAEASAPSAESRSVQKILDAELEFGFYEPQPIRQIFEEMIGDLFFEGRVEVGPGVDGDLQEEKVAGSVRQVLDHLCEDVGCVWEATGDPPTLYIRSGESSSGRP